MRSEPTKAFATRLPATEAKRLEEAVNETDLTKSTLIRQAIGFYIAENPDQIVALFPEHSAARFIAEMEE